MTLIIDGYNLLHASGILGRGRGPGGLERSRNALLNFLAESLDDAQRADTIVVFDALAAPKGLPRSIDHRGLKVRFAEQGAEADDVIEQLILADSSPRRLIVVSSDHRLHRAARRRRAKPIDSDRWYAETVRNRIERARRDESTSKGEFNSAQKPSEPVTDGEVRFWLKQFGLEADASDAAPERESSPKSPFPPGYGEDVREENV
jgi:predicted RNA-binding protein with PIN domain